MSKWRECKLGNFSEIQTGPFGSQLHAADYVDSGIPSIMPTNIGNRLEIKTESIAHITKIDSLRLERYLVEENDIVYSRRGDVEKCAFITSNQSGWLCGTGCLRVRITSKDIEPKYCAYYLSTEEIKGWVSGNAVGTTMPNLNSSILKRLPLLLPPLPEQKAIAAVLSSLDDKISLLHRQNKTLEAMAETLFRQWFVEEAQEDWEVGTLGDILLSIESGSRPKGGIDPDLKIGISSIGAENINGIGNYDFSKTKYVTEDFFRSMKKGVIKSHDVLIYKDGAYVGRKGMFGKGFPYKTCSVNEHVFILRANEKFNQVFLYFMLQEEELAQLNANSAQPGLNQESMKSFEIIIPPQSLIDNFNDVVAPWVDKIFFNSNQIRTLEKLRDTLLPKLMSGEVRVAA